MFKVFESTNSRDLQKQIDAWLATPAMAEKVINYQGLTWAPNNGTISAIFKYEDAPAG